MHLIEVRNTLILANQEKMALINAKNAQLIEQHMEELIRRLPEETIFNMQIPEQVIGEGSDILPAIEILRKQYDKTASWVLKSDNTISFQIND